MLKHITPLITLPEFNLSAETLAKFPAKPCGSFDRFSAGFVAPIDGALLLHWLTPKCGIFCLEVEEKILPSSVVKAETAKCAKAIEAKDGFKPGRKQLREIAEVVEAELLPKALTKKRRTYAAIASDYLLIDTSSATKADEVIEALKLVMEELPLTLVRPVSSPGMCMTTWLSEGECGVSAFTLDRSCVLQQHIEERGTVRYKNINVDSEDIRSRIAKGFVVTELAITYNDRLSFVLTEGLTLKKVKVLDVILDNVEIDEGDDKAAIENSQWLISISECCNALDELIDTLGGRAEA